MSRQVERKLFSTPKKHDCGCTTAWDKVEDTYVYFNACKIHKPLVPQDHLLGDK